MCGRLIGLGCHVVKGEIGGSGCRAVVETVRVQMYIHIYIHIHIQICSYVLLEELDARGAQGLEAHVLHVVAVQVLFCMINYDRLGGSVYVCVFMCGCRVVGLVD